MKNKSSKVHLVKTSLGYAKIYAVHKKFGPLPSEKEKTKTIKCCIKYPDVLNYTHH